MLLMCYAIIVGLLVFGLVGAIINTGVEYECLSYGYPKHRGYALGNPAYCIRHIFGVDEVRALEELRAKGKE